MFPLRDTVPRRHPPVVVLALISINALVFLYQASLPARELQYVIYHYALVPLRYSEPGWARANGLDPDNLLPLLTNAFMHGGWFHLLANMWTLWIFGPAVEDRLGKPRFIAFYLVCGVLASLSHAAFNSRSPVPALGASGAIAGVMGGYVMLFPRARILFLVPILFIPYFVELPALIYAAFWFVIQFLQGTAGLLQPAMAGGVAWWAHIGGFVVGLVTIPFVRLPDRRDRRSPSEDGIGRRQGPWGERR
jgi:membrane associated rhomboid family serine protease